MRQPKRRDYRRRRPSTGIRPIQLKHISTSIRTLTGQLGNIGRQVNEVGACLNQVEDRILAALQSGGIRVHAGAEEKKEALANFQNIIRRGRADIRREYCEVIRDLEEEIAVFFAGLR